MAEVLTIQQAAKELQVSVDTIRRAYRAKDVREHLPVVRVGLAVRIRRDDFDQWVDRRTA